MKNLKRVSIIIIALVAMMGISAQSVWASSRGFRRTRINRIKMRHIRSAPRTTSLRGTSMRSNFRMNNVSSLGDRTNGVRSNGSRGMNSIGTTGYTRRFTRSVGSGKNGMDNKTFRTSMNRRVRLPKYVRHSTNQSRYARSSRKSSSTRKPVTSKSAKWVVVSYEK